MSVSSQSSDFESVSKRNMCDSMASLMVASVWVLFTTASFFELMMWMFRMRIWFCKRSLNEVK